MKITCDSCGSKYSIADAKVKGRKVKVRCKGCKESILVDGTKIGEEGSAADDSAAASDSAPEAAAPDAGASSDAPAEDSAPAGDSAPADAPDDGPKKDLWSVNLTDDDSRDMTLDELVSGWKDGTVTSDAYVWKDGMGDWKPILEVGELKLKLGSAPKKSGGVVSSAAAAPAAAASAAGDGKMDDLFGGVDAAGDEPAEAEKPAAALGGDGKPTGARNDSSVLFSLDSLNTGDDGKSKTEAADLFGNLGASGGAALTNNADLLTAPAKDPPVAPAGARVAAAPEPSKGKGGLIAAILGAALIIGGAVFFLGGSDAPEEDPAALKAAAEAEKKAEEAQKKADEERKKMAAELKKMQDELKKAREEAVERGEDPEEAAKKKQEELDKAKAEEEAKKAEAAKSGSSKSSGSASSKPAAKSDTAAKKEEKPKAKPAASSGGPAFDVGAARAALAAAAANAKACKKPGGPTGSGKAQVTFSTSGRVTSANVISGPFGGTAVGGCVASTFRRARVPKFSGSPKTVAKSFRIN